jgi:hypothetical protein
VSRLIPPNLIDQTLAQTFTSGPPAVAIAEPIGGNQRTRESPSQKLRVDPKAWIKRTGSFTIDGKRYYPVNAVFFARPRLRSTIAPLEVGI